MHPRRYSRDENEPEIVEAFEALGCKWQPLGEPVDGMAAIPIGRDWCQMFVEIKLPTGKRGGTSHSVLTPAQRKFFDRWPVQLRAVVRTPDDVAELVRYEQQKRITT